MLSIQRSGAATTAAVWVLVGIIGFFLLTEHQAHLFGILPWLFLLACPAMHWLMHRGHHQKHDSADQATPEGHDSRHGHHSNAQTEHGELS